MSTMKRPSVSENPSLHYLYVLGGIATCLGVIVGTIAAFNVESGNPFSGTVGLNPIAATFQTLGFGLASAGLLAIVGAAVAQAINWQIMNPRDDSQAKTFREHQAEHE